MMGRPEALTPERAHDVAPDDIALGSRIFQGEAAGGTCAGCHGSNTKGSSLAPSLVNHKWLWGNGSLQSIEQTVANGISQPKNIAIPCPLWEVLSLRRLR